MRRRGGRRDELWQLLGTYPVETRRLERWAKARSLIFVPSLRHLRTVRARVICRASRPSIATGCGLVLNYVECEKTHSSQDPHEHMLEGEEVLKHKAPYIQIPSLRLSTATSC